MNLDHKTIEGGFQHEDTTQPHKSYNTMNIWSLKYSIDRSQMYKNMPSSWKESYFVLV
jgi:hypothetical protein